MGRLEKIVVLTVLFLVAVVLGVALTPTGDAAARGEGRGPVQGAADPKPAVQKPESANQPPHLLSAGAEVPANVEKHEAPVGDTKSAPAASPQGSNIAGAPGAIGNPVAPSNPATPVAKPEPVVAPFLVTNEGLEPSGMADTMFYAWKQGDTFAALALRYYGSKDKVGRLTKANEGRTEASMKVDERLWIPVAESLKGEALAEGKFYIVKSGDVLSGISQQFYGTSKKWQKILDANRDTLASPEKLRPGMKLRIPE